MADQGSDTGTPRQRLRALLDAHRLPFTSADPAACVAQPDFDAIYMGGVDTPSALLGNPEIALLGETGMIEHARRIVESVGLPVIADANTDKSTGYGGALDIVQDVERIVRDYEQAGIAALQLHDTASPESGRHMSGKSRRVIPVDQMLSKLQAAVATRTDCDLVLIARTEALAEEGVDATIERARRYVAAGADVLWVEAPRNASAADARMQLARVALALDTPLLLNLAQHGHTPALDIERIHRMKFALVLFPLGATLALAAQLRAEAAAAQTALPPATPAARGAVLQPRPRLRFDSISNAGALRAPGTPVTPGMPDAPPLPHH
ncbi:isocitrate lyase/PEP mutase family protein [Paraburkholderia jirisanensis]